MIFFSQKRHGARTCQAGGGVDAGGQLGGNEEGQGRGVQVGNLSAGQVLRYLQVLFIFVQLVAGR